MGGKHKQAQRTKNNARPSSSGRSAELLGSSIPQFVGFSTVKEAGIVLPGFSLSVMDDIDSSVEMNFQLVLKKMNKKDSTTKLKALQEFTELTKTAETDAIKAVLPFWPRLYCILATDTNHKVREATHVAHHQIVLKAKRNLAPFLKQLAGPWFTSQYDTYAPAASAAKQSFQDAFPENKIQEVVVFCQEEILSYIFDNLTVHTVQTLSNSKTISSEEAEAKYQRVIISSLHGYALYLHTVSTEQIEKKSELNLKLLSNTKFWKLAKHNDAPVKAAWFSIIVILSQKSQFLMEKEAGHIVSSVFGNLDENEPTVLNAVWESALSIISTMKEWWKHVSVEKLVLPKLFKLLKKGGQGSASVIFPNLLPVISCLPEETDMNSVYFAFFENMCVGIKLKCVAKSRSETLAICTAFVECLQFIIMKNQSDLALCEKLIKMQLLPLLEWSLVDSEALGYKSIYNQTATFIQYLTRNCSNPDFKNYSKYIDYFWNNITSLFEGLMLNLEHNYEKNALSQLASRQIELLLSLKHSAKPRKHLKVTFTTENQSDSSIVHASSINVCADESYSNYLNHLTYRTCENFVKFVNEKHTNYLIEYLMCLIQNFDSENFFRLLNTQFGGGNETSLIDIYRKLLIKWLKSKQLCSPAVIDLIFLLFKYLQSDEKLEVLDSFGKIVMEEDCLGWCIAQTLSHPHHSDPIIHAWLCNEQVSQFLVNIVEKELADECTPNLSLLLKRAFTEKGDGELFINKGTISNIIRILNKSLLDPLNYPTTIDTCASFASYISAILYTSNFKLKYGDELFLAMFSLLITMDTKNESETISKDTLWEVKTAWQDVVCVFASELSLSDFTNIIAKCANMIEKKLLHDNIDFDTDHIVDLILSTVKCLQNSSPLRINDMLSTLLLKCTFIPVWKYAINQICSSVEFIRGSLCSPYKSIKIEQLSVNENDILNFFIWMDLISCVLTKPIVLNEEELEDNCDAEMVTILEMVELNSDIDNTIVDLVLTLALANSFTSNFNCTKYINCISTKYSTIKENLEELIKGLGQDYIERIESILIKNLYSESTLWTKAIYIYFSEIIPNDLHETYRTLTKNCSGADSPHVLLHLTQIFATSITYDEIWDKLTPIESFIVLRSLIHCNELDVQIAEAFSKINLIQKENRALFLYNSSVWDIITWEQTELISEVMRFYTSVLKYKPEMIQSNCSDLIFMPLALWSKNIAESKNRFKELQVTSLIYALSNLFVTVSEYIQKCDKESIVSEWRDVFVQDINRDFVEIWIYVCEEYQKNPETFSTINLPFLQEFGKAITYLDYTSLFSTQHPNLPKWSKLLKQCCTLLTHPVLTLQSWGYNMLMKLLPGLIEVDSLAVTTNMPHEKGLIFEQFKHVLCHTQDIVQSMLLDFRLGEDSCRVQPFTDSYTYTFAYILIWDVLLTLCEQASTELRYQYADWLRNEDFLYKLLDNIYKLMPIEIMHCNEGKVKHFTGWFTTKFSISQSGVCTSEHIEQMICWIYSSTLEQLSPLVRQWWGQQETRTKQIVERVTATFVSPQLCQRELAHVAQHESKFKNMVVKVHSSFREVVAVYTIDEAQMELIITLPNNYPLKGPDVQCNKQIHGTSHRQWLMQLTMCLQHQNGRIWDGLSLWNNNLDKKFDGVEECYICFAVLHHGTYQLPKLSCQTCKKKFHSACLYKWFSTSNKSTCPICRHLF